MQEGKYLGSAPPASRSKRAKRRTRGMNRRYVVPYHGEFIDIEGLVNLCCKSSSLPTKDGFSRGAVLPIGVMEELSLDVFDRGDPLQEILDYFSPSNPDGQCTS